MGAFKKDLVINNLHTIKGSGSLPSIVVQKSSESSVVLETSCRGQQSVGALNLGHLDVPLPGGGGVCGADEGIHLVTSGAGVNIHVLSCQGSTQ